MTKLQGSDIIIAYPSYPCGGIGVAIWRCDRWTGGQNVWRFCQRQSRFGKSTPFPVSRKDMRSAAYASSDCAEGLPPEAGIW